eukprot:4005259-Amphidinium_carterae.1
MSYDTEEALKLSFSLGVDLQPVRFCGMITVDLKDVDDDTHYAADVTDGEAYSIYGEPQQSYGVVREEIRPYTLGAYG